jgi:hypothetical protein
MGYYVHLAECRVMIPQSNFEPACTHLKNIGFLTDTDYMTGGRYSEGEKRDYWYSWVNMEELAKCIENNDLVGVFQCFSFETEIDRNGNLIDLYYSSKSGNEEHLLHCLAEFFRNGDYLQWRGEDEDSWRNSFNNGKMEILVPEIIWTMP